MMKLYYVIKNIFLVLLFCCFFVVFSGFVFGFCCFVVFSGFVFVSLYHFFIWILSFGVGSSCTCIVRGRLGGMHGS